MTLDEAISEVPLVAILRGVRPDEVLDHAAALFNAGLRAVEVPLNSPNPFESVRLLHRAYGGRMAVGAGTVTSADDVDAVAGAGGGFVVAPNTDPAVIGRAVSVGLEVAPGFATATEALLALASGARHLKLFPASTYGVAHLRHLRAVLPPEARVWAVGGVSPASIADWTMAGADAFGLGGELYRSGQAATLTHAKAIGLIRALDAARPG